MLWMLSAYIWLKGKKGKRNETGGILVCRTGSIHYNFQKELNVFWG